MSTATLEIPDSIPQPGRQALLSKTDFKLASTCPTKLYYRKAGYPDARNFDAYLAMLAQGGYMVEKLAKLQYPGGITIDTSRGHLEAAEETLRLLRSQTDVVLFEATFVHAGRLCRVDILRKEGDVIHLMEVKAKLLDEEGEAERLEKSGSYFRDKRRPFNLLTKWEPYLEDVAYQYTIVRDVLPDLTVIPYLVLVREQYSCPVDGLPQCFSLIEREDGRLADVVFNGDESLIRRQPMTVTLDVTREVTELEDTVRARAKALCQSLSPLTKLPARVGKHCADCEFSVPRDEGTSGFAECWADRSQRLPLVIDLFYGGPAVDALLEEGINCIHDVSAARFDKQGPVAFRQRIQIEHTQRGSEWLDPRLNENLASAQYPLHFIDFEAARLAVPQFAGMRPYGLLAFQWSCHTQREPGGPLEHHEWLNTDEPWPNKSFAESLRRAIGDEGSVLVWSHFEPSILKDIANDLAKFGPDPELAAWLRDVASPESGRIIDLHDLCRKYYFHPRMGGRTSIKYVLDAVWRTNEQVRRRFTEIEGLVADEEKGPYAALPAIVIGDAYEVVADGGNAMRAYEAMMYGVESSKPEVKEAWRRLLLQYCRLDTLAMVLIQEHWLTY